MACQNVSEMSNPQSFFDSFDTVLTDCDGVLWKGNQAIDGSPEMIQKFRQMGKKVIFVTNNSTKSRQEYVKKCSDLGFGGTPSLGTIQKAGKSLNILATFQEEIFTTSYLTASYLHGIGFQKKVYLYGTQGIAKELDNFGIEHIGLGPDPVPDEGWSSEVVSKAASQLDPQVGCVIASIDYHTSYVKMLKAVSYLNDPEVIFLATNMDERFPYSQNLVMPGTGSLVMGIITASRRQPKIFGKPEAVIFEAVQKDFPNISPQRTLMIGDNTKTDIMLGKNCGLQTLLVGTGVDTLEAAQKWKTSDEASLEEKQRVPDFCVQKLGDLLTLTSS